MSTAQAMFNEANISRTLVADALAGRCGATGNIGNPVDGRSKRVGAATLKPNSGQ